MKILSLCGFLPGKPQTSEPLLISEKTSNEIQERKLLAKRNQAKLEAKDEDINKKLDGELEFSDSLYSAKANKKPDENYSSG